MIISQFSHWARAVGVRLQIVIATVLFFAFSLATMHMVPPARAAEPPAVAPGSPGATLARPQPLSIVSTPSARYTPVSSRTIDTIVVHYMSGINVDPDRWDDPALSRQILTQHRVSAHYLIDRQGTVYQLVKEKNIAWHAGGSLMPGSGRKNVNRFSVGIELIATKRSGFTDAQYDALAQLVDGIRARHPIRHIVGHDEIAGARAVRHGLRKDAKVDPGPLFDWSRVPGRA